MVKTIVHDLAIIGNGIVGLAGAVYAGRLELKTIIIGKEEFGTIAKTDVVENYPGFKKISGLDLAGKIKEHANEYKKFVHFEDGTVDKILWSKKNCFIVKTKKKHFHAKTVLFCTGSKWRKLGVSGEKKFDNKGIQYCALCDGPLYKGKVLAVVGGGDSAAKEALVLARYAAKVYVIARSKLRPEPVNVKRIKAEKKIQILEGYQVKDVIGKTNVENVVLNKPFDGSKELAIGGVFVDIGHIPLSNLAVKLGVKVNKNKEIIINKDSQTNIKGVYAAGDVADTKFKQAITGVGEVVKAVYGIYEYINDERVICSCTDEQ